MYMNQKQSSLCVHTTHEYIHANANSTSLLYYLLPRFEHENFILFPSELNWFSMKIIQIPPFWRLPLECYNPRRQKESKGSFRLWIGWTFLRRRSSSRRQGGSTRRWRRATPLPAGGGGGGGGRRHHRGRYGRARRDCARIRCDIWSVRSSLHTRCAEQLQGVCNQVSKISVAQTLFLFHSKCNASVHYRQQTSSPSLFIWDPLQSLLTSLICTKLTRSNTEYSNSFAWTWHDCLLS